MIESAAEGEGEARGETRARARERERQKSAVSLSVPHIGSGSPTLQAVRYTGAERSAVSLSHACQLAAEENEG